MKKEILSKTIVTVISTLVVGLFWWLWASVQPWLTGLMPPAMSAAAASCRRTVWLVVDWFVGPVPIPTWLYLVLAATSFVALVRTSFTWLARRRESRRADVVPLFHAFTEFRRFGLVWRWAWSGRRISCVNAFCPQCDRLIRYDEDSASAGTRPTILYCPHCAPVRVERPGKFPHIKSEVTLEIEHAVRTGEWRQQVTAMSASKRAA